MSDRSELKAVGGFIHQQFQNSDNLLVFHKQGPCMAMGIADMIIAEIHRRKFPDRKCLGLQQPSTIELTQNLSTRLKDPNETQNFP